MESILNAGYCTQYFWGIRNELGCELDQQLKNLSTFSLLMDGYDCPKTSIREDAEFILTVYDNLICRGIPTFCSLLVERSLAKSAKPFICENGEEIGSIKFIRNKEHITKAQETQWVELLRRAHFPIDPRINPELFPENSFDSYAEEYFHKQYFPSMFDSELALLLQPQRIIKSMGDHTEMTEFVDQRVDFSLEVGQHKFVFEVDGSHHGNDRKQSFLDQARDRYLLKGGWDIFRIPTSVFKEDNKWDQIETFSSKVTDDPIIEIFKKNYQSPLWMTKLGRSALRTVLVPYAIARAQRVLLMALEMNILSLEMDHWDIVVIERDVRSIILALQDFFDYIQAFYDLLAIKNTLPRVNLTVFHTDEFSYDPYFEEFSSDHSHNIKIKIFSLTDYQNRSFPADIVIDSSILAYQGYLIPDRKFYEQQLKFNGHYFIIRNAFSYEGTRNLSLSKPRTYAIDNELFSNGLGFFLNNIFRKHSFRDGQEKIIKRALSLKPVIGLLPTGSGKSLCYQLSALLQPGLSLVIDPLVSLIHDQVQNLKDQYAIDWIDSLSSNQDPEARSVSMDNLAKGNLKFIFISPERVQNKDFRKNLERVSSKLSTTYTIIDEAHCVSEWGHDFRTSYLKLAQTIDAVCCFNGYRPTIIALTGTASFNVLSDVQREIGVNDESALIFPKSFDRPELNFDIVEVSSEDKSRKLKNVLDSIAGEFGFPPDEAFKPGNEKTIAGIVYAPHVNGKFGVEQICDDLRTEFDVPIKYFSGSVPKKTRRGKGGVPEGKMTYKEFGSYKKEVQDKFKNNEISILVATKSFGMGIDKSNIRYTIHYNIPQSLESFYQEAGRAGRNGENAYCVVLFSDDNPSEATQALSYELDDSEVDQLVTSRNGGDIHRLLFLHRNSFKGRDSEFHAAMDVFKGYIKEDLNYISPGEIKTIIIPFEKDKTIREKAIYRMSIIGLIRDYTIDFHKRLFEVEIFRQDEKFHYIEQLKQYIGRYRTREYAESLVDDVLGMNGSTYIEKCLRYLLNFVYDEIERKRRTAIKNIAEVARKSVKLSSSQERDDLIRNELLSYLEHSRFTDGLRKISEGINPEDWHTILDTKDPNGDLLLKSVDGVRMLLGGCRRALESKPDHGGLLFLNAIAKLLLPEADQESAMLDMEYAVQSLDSVSEQLQETAILMIDSIICEWLSNDQDFEGIRKSFAGNVLNKYPKRPYAQRFLEVFPDYSENILINLILTDISRLNKKILDDKGA